MGFFNTNSIITAFGFTMSIWVKIPSSQVNLFIMTVADQARGTGTIDMFMAPNGNQPGVQTFDGTNQPQAFGGSINDGAWHHIAGQFTSGSSFAIFVDGTKTSPGANSSAPTGMDTLTVGGHYSSGVMGAFINADLAHAAVWNVALADAECVALSKGVNPTSIHVLNLQAYYPLYGLDPSFNLTDFFRNDTTVTKDMSSNTGATIPASTTGPKVQPMMNALSGWPGNLFFGKSLMFSPSFAHMMVR